jgi:hypothetical protein
MAALRFCQAAGPGSSGGVRGRWSWAINWSCGQGLRKRHPPQERQLLASLAEGGRLPIVVVNEAARFVVIDGYKRVRTEASGARQCAARWGWRARSAAAGADFAVRARCTRSGLVLGCRSALVCRWKSSRGAQAQQGWVSGAWG